MPKWVKKNLQYYYATGQTWKAKVLSELWIKNNNVFKKD